MNTGGALLKRSSGYAGDVERGLTPASKVQIPELPQRCGGSRTMLAPVASRLQRTRPAGYTLTVVKILPPPSNTREERE